MNHQDTLERLQELKSRLREPIATFSELQTLLTQCLEALYLLPDSVPSSAASSSKQANRVDPISHKAQESIFRALGSIHASLLETVLPIWSAQIEEDPLSWQLLEQVFAPTTRDRSSSVTSSENSSSSLGSLAALSAYHSLSTSLANKGTKGFLVSLLLKLVLRVVERYNLHDLYHVIYLSSSSQEPTSSNGHSRTPANINQNLQWEEAVKTVVALPARVANAVGNVREMSGGMKSMDVPGNLEPKPYFDKLCVHLEGLMWELSQGEQPNFFALEHLLTKLHRTGLLQSPAPSPPDSRRPSLFTPMFPSLLSHLRSSIEGGKNGKWYSTTFFPDLLEKLPSQVYTAVVWSFLLHLTAHLKPDTSSDEKLPPDSVSPSPAVKIAANYLDAFIGTPSNTSDNWDTLVSEVFLTRSKGREDAIGLEMRVRVIAAWIGLGGEEVIGAFLDRLIDVWTDAREIRFGLFGRLRYLTQLLILTLSLLPFGHPKLVKLAYHSPLLMVMQIFLGHSDPAVRRLGMLVAEIVSQMTIPETVEERKEREDRLARRMGKRRKLNADTKDKTTQEVDQLMGELDIDEEGNQKSMPKPPMKIKRLDFGPSIWNGTGEGREECRYLRAFVGLRDASATFSSEEDDPLLGWKEGVDNASSASNRASNSGPAPGSTAIPINLPRVVVETSKNEDKPRGRRRAATVDSDDESLVGYSSDDRASSSRSPSPTPSYLEEIAADPMLNMNTRGKVERPVYVGQLIDLLKAREEPDKLEVGLKWGESLIRRKREFGKELEENAVQLTTMLLALHDNYNLEGFEDRRQGMLIALTAAVPKLVAPYLTQQYFDGQYALTQRFAILTALCMGAREAAGLSPVIKPDLPRVDFPSKFLPATLHRKYIADNDTRQVKASHILIDVAANDIGDQLLSKKGSEASQRTEAPLVRERRLRVGKQPTKHKFVDGDANMRDSTMIIPTPPTIHYKDIAAEYFVLPMINRFWSHFENEVTREARARSAYRAAGTGMVLSPLAIAKYLSTLAIMVHAARHSTAFLSVIAPEALELAVVVGQNVKTQPETLMNADGVKDAESEADVVGSALELALVCLDASKELDGGRTLVTDKMNVLMSTGEWAGQLFETEHKGVSTSMNAGGLSEGRTRKAAAGVIVLVSEIVETSRHLLGWTMT